MSINTTSLPVRSFRKYMKSQLKDMGLLSTFLTIRALWYNFFRLLGVVPLSVLIKPMFYYIKFLWWVNPDFKSLKDYLPQLIGQQTTTVHRRIEATQFSFDFFTPNALCQSRADTFTTKEPETLEWIDEYAKGGVLFDIGANVGLYTIYHAKTQNASVYAFEPSVFNLALLVKNINANGLQSKVKVITNPLTSSCFFADFKLPSTDEGGALSGFGVDYGHDGKPLNSNVSYQTFGLSLDYLLTSGALKEKPTLIKIDVDGIEHLILEGAKTLLCDPVCRSVLVEINECFTMQALKIEEILTSCGFEFKYKKRALVYDAQGVDVGTYNHIWVKS